MNIFYIEDGVAKPTEYTLAISPFKEIWERDKSKDKSGAIKDFTFINFFINPSSNNPFFSIADREQRQHEIIVSVPLLKDYKPDELVFKAIDKYDSMLKEYSVSYRAYRALQNSLKVITEMIENLEGDSCKDVLKIPDLLKAAKELQPLIRQVSELGKMIEQDLKQDNQIYGGGTINPFEQ